MTNDNTHEVVKSVPILATILAVVMIIAAVVLVLFSDSRNQPSTLTVIGLIVASIPGLLAAAFAERTSKDIRNGVVKEKAKQGAQAAIREEQVLTRDGPVVGTSLQALQRLLEHNTSVTKENTAVVQQALENGREDDSNG